VDRVGDGADRLLEHPERVRIRHHQRGDVLIEQATYRIDLEHARRSGRYLGDEDPATLGDDIALPPFLEPHRDKIVAGLKPIE
jgi:hypothetical protein